MQQVREASQGEAGVAQVSAGEGLFTTRGTESEKITPEVRVGAGSPRRAFVYTGRKASQFSQRHPGPSCIIACLIRPGPGRMDASRNKAHVQHGLVVCQECPP